MFLNRFDLVNNNTFDLHLLSNILHSSDSKITLQLNFKQSIAEGFFNLHIDAYLLN